MKERHSARRTSKYIFLMVAFLLILNISLGYILMKQAQTTVINLMQTRMLDISNTAAAMINGDDLKDITPEDKGTEKYDSIMRTLTYFQDNIDLKYIYCIRDMGDGTFTFGLDPTVEDPGEFGSPIVYTEALEKASKGTASADDKYYEDAWGKFYSAYSPVFDSNGDVAGIIAVDFSAEWYDKQLASFTWITIIVALISLLIGGIIVMTIISRTEKRLGSIRGKLDDLETTLMQEMNKAPGTEPAGGAEQDQESDEASFDSLGERIQSMESELKTQIAIEHNKAYKDGLTGVKSKQAYLETEKVYDEQIKAHLISDFSVVVCDVNGLKKINDTQGHKAGDEYLMSASNMICDIFDHSPVFRVGGDEFAVILTGRDHENRTALMNKLHDLSSAHITTGEAIVAGGLADYDPAKDHDLDGIFDRADTEMYKEKMILKSLGASIRDLEPDQSGEAIEYDEITETNARRALLIADDVESNREILGDLLEDDYDIFYAADGIETMDMLRSHRDEIAVLLLDLYMPNMTGREVMAEMKADESLRDIPVIVITVDQDAEVDCLTLGAMDFITKPYPDIDIIKARIRKCIELYNARKAFRRKKEQVL